MIILWSLFNIALLYLIYYLISNKVGDGFDIMNENNCRKECMSKFSKLIDTHL